MKKVSIILGAAIIAAFSVSADALTLSDIRTSARRHIRDSDSLRVSDSILNSMANEVQRDMNNSTWAVQTSTAFTLAVGTTYYDLPTDYLTATRGLFKAQNGTVTQIREDSEKIIYDGLSDYERSSKGTSPTLYFVRQSTQSDTVMEIAFLPVATSTASTGTVRIDYIMQPSDLSADSDVPFEGLRHLYPYHDTLVWGIVFRVKALQGLVEEANFYGTLYDRGLQSMIDNKDKMPNFRPSVRGIGK